MVGVHTPEFSFKHDLENVRRPLASMAIDYPIAVDNDYAIWDAPRNHYWPALYFIDADGTIRHHWFGEGDYERSEAVIQQLLRDAGADGVGDEVWRSIPSERRSRPTETTSGRPRPTSAPSELGTSRRETGCRAGRRRTRTKRPTAFG